MELPVHAMPKVPDSHLLEHVVNAHVVISEVVTVVCFDDLHVKAVWHYQGPVNALPCAVLMQQSPVIQFAEFRLSDNDVVLEIVVCKCAILQVCHYMTSKHITSHPLSVSPCVLLG